MSSKYAIFRFIIIVLSIIVSVGLIRSIWEHRGRWAIVDNRQEVLLKEQARNVLLQEKLQEATSSVFIEKQAREKLGLARPEDTIVLMAFPGVDSSVSGEHNDLKLTNAQRWRRLFF